MVDTTTSWQGYAYTDLTNPDDIRLIELHPGKDNEEIHCSILRRGLETSPSYEALSYTWGSNRLEKTIYCSDSSNTYEPLLVTSNCYAALRRLRWSHISRLLWIDAICINQIDRERNVQVALMPRIYQRASQVVIHLGEDADASQLVMEIARTKEWWGQEEPRLKPDETSTLQPWERAIVRAFISRPWFSRVWILQEVFMAREAVVLCGDQEVSWKRFVGVFHLAGWEIIGSSNMVSIHYVMNMDPWVKRKLPLLAVLQRARFYQSSDPRDKIFAVAGMSQSSLEACLVPNYGKTTAEVYTEVAKFLLEDTGLMFLSDVQGRPRLPNLPSWVPDWSQYPTHNPSASFSEEVMAWSTKKRAGGNPDLRSAQIFDSASPGELPCLKVRGFRLDTIAFVGKACEVRDWYWKDTIRAWFEAIAAELFGDSSTNAKQAFYQIVAPTSSRRSSVSQRCLEMVLDNRPLGRGNGYRESLEAQYRIRVTGRRLVITEKVYVGLGPLGARDGDLVCIFLGGNVPFVLRPLSCGYEMIGECILDGVMEGQALEHIDVSTAHASVPVAPLEDFAIA